MSNIIGVVGMPGRGKTATAVYIAYKLYHRKARKVISNTPLNFTHQFVRRPVIPKDGSLPVEFEAMLGDPDNLHKRALLLADEVHAWMDSRESMTTGNRVLTEFITQLRKRGLDMIYTTQDFGYADRRLRRLTTHIVECKHMTKGGWMRGDHYTGPFLPGRDYEAQPVWLFVKPVFSLYDTFYRVKRMQVQG